MFLLRIREYLRWIIKRSISPIISEYSPIFRGNISALLFHLIFHRFCLAEAHFYRKNLHTTDSLNVMWNSICCVCDDGIIGFRAIWVEQHTLPLPGNWRGNSDNCCCQPILLISNALTEPPVVNAALEWRMILSRMRNATCKMPSLVLFSHLASVTCPILIV